MLIAPITVPGFLIGYRSNGSFRIQIFRQDVDRQVEPRREVAFHENMSKQAITAVVIAKLVLGFEGSERRLSII